MVCLLSLMPGALSADSAGEQSPAPLPAAQTQRVPVTGRVVDRNGDPVVGATVSAPSVNVVVITDGNGEYSITAPGGDAELQFALLGYTSQTVTVGTRRVIDIVLEDSITVMDDVVVVAYGTQTKATITGSISSVTTKDLLQSPQANISNALAGRMPGLFVVQRSGEPGRDASTLRIRGTGTFAGNQDPLVMVDGIESSNYNNIDPNEIESLSILKDASATAVYGVRGANGVILITTKRGIVGPPQISLSTNVAVSNFPFLRENMNSYDYTSSYNKALAYDSYVTGNYTLRWSEDAIENYRTGTDPVLYPSTDWYDYMLRDFSSQTQSNLNIRGGTERVKYFFSLGYFTQNGMLDTDVYPQNYDYQIKYRRYNLRSNFDINITNNLTASFDISTQMDDTRGPNWETGLLMEMLSSVPPNTTPGIIDGKLVTIGSITNDTWNPLFAYDKGWHTDYANTLNGTVRLNYKMDFLLKGLEARGNVTYKNYNLNIKKYETSGISYDARRTETGDLVLRPTGDAMEMRYGEEVRRNRRMVLEAGFYYNRQFGDHTVAATTFYTQTKYHDPTLAFLIPNGYQGLLGRLEYNFRQKYIAEFTMGYNGTENFAEGRRFGFFPSASLGWVPTEETFFPKNDVVTFLKLRATYGIVGNDRIGGDRFLYRPTAYTYYDNAYYFGETGSSYQSYQGSREGKLGNPLLTWEKKKAFNVAVDFRLLKDKVGLTLEYFDERRDNILYNRGTVPGIVGMEMPAYNLGSMKNSGWEGELSYDDRFGEFGFFAKANYTFARNMIVFQDEAQWAYPYLYRTGQRSGQFFGYVADGLYNSWEEVNDVNRPVYQWSNNRIQPGDVKYKDINGDGRITSDDVVPIGYTNFPEVVFGLSVGGSYNGFDFSVLFQGATNVSSMPSRRTMRGFFTATSASQDIFLRSWSQENYDAGKDIAYPRFSVSNDDHNYQTSTFWLEDATYVRLKNMEIGYTFRGNLLQAIGVQGLRLYANGNNLITWCNLRQGEDPEYPQLSAGSEPYPLTRTFNLGVNINF